MVVRVPASEQEGAQAVDGRPLSLDLDFVMLANHARLRWPTVREIAA